MIKLLNTFNEKEKKTFYSIVFFFLVFFVFRVITNYFYLFDSHEYLYVAKKFHDFSFFNSSIESSLTTKRPFVYPLFLAIFHNFPIYISILFQTLISIYTFYIIFKIIKKYAIEIKRWYLLFFLFTPSIFIYTQLVMSEWLVMFFVTLLFWLLIQKWNAKNFMFIQIITILLAFTKPIFYPLIYLNLGFFTIYFIKKRMFSFWLIIPFIVLQFYLNFNEKKSGYRHFSSIENTNLINYNLYYFKVKNESPQKADLWLDSIYNSSFKKKNFREQNIYLRKIAINEIKQNFFEYTYYHLFTAIRGVFDPGRFDLMTFFRKEDGQQGFLAILNGKKPISFLFKNKFVYVYLLLIPIFLINLLKWFYFFKFLFLKKLNFRVYYFISILTSYILISGPVNSSRYMMPFQGIIIVFAFLGMKHKTL